MKYPDMASLKYQVVFHDVHGVLASHRNRAIYAAIKTAAELGITSQQARREFLNQLLYRNESTTQNPYGRDNAGYDGKVSARDFLTQQYGPDAAQYYSAVNEGLYIHQYGWMIPVLAKLGAGIEVISNGRMSDIQGFLSSRWKNHIDGIYARGVGGNLNECSRKPNPDPLLHALNMLKLRGRHIHPESALYVGDYDIDVQAAQAAGIRSALVVAGNEQMGRALHLHPDYVLLLNSHTKYDEAAFRQEGIQVGGMRDLPSVVAGRTIGIRRINGEPYPIDLERETSRAETQQPSMYGNGKEF